MTGGRTFLAEETRSQRRGGKLDERQPREGRLEATCAHGLLGPSLAGPLLSSTPSARLRGPLDFPGSSDGERIRLQCRRHRRLGSDPWVGKIPWRRTWQPLQYSCLGKPMDRGAWWATVHGVAKSQTRLSGSHTQGDLI